MTGKIFVFLCWFLSPVIAGNANDTHLYTRNRRRKLVPEISVPVSGASDTQFGTEFYGIGRALFSCRLIVPVFGADFLYVCHWHKITRKQFTAIVVNRSEYTENCREITPFVSHLWAKWDKNPDRWGKNRPRDGNAN